MTPTCSFNVYSLPPAVTAVGLLLVGVALLIRERASRLSTALFLVELAVSLWLFGQTGMYCATNEAAAVRWARFQFLGIPFIPSTIYLASVVVMGIYARRKRLIWAGFLLSAFFSAAGLGSHVLVTGVYRYWWGYYPRYGWLGIPFLTFFAGLWLSNLRDYWVEYRKAEPGTHRRRLRALLIPFNFAYLGAFEYLPCYGVPLYPFGYLPAFVCVVLTARVAWRYRLVDIVPAFAANEIIATMADPLAVCDADGRIRVVNQSLRATLGYTEQELLGERIERLVGADAGGVERLRQLLSSGMARDEEMVLRAQAGEPVAVSVSLSPLQGGGRNRLGTVLIARDIREQKRAESERERLFLEREQAGTALRTSEERLRLITETIEEVFWMADVGLTHMFYVSPAYARISGRTRESLYQTPRSFIDDIHPEDRERVLADLAIGRSGPPFDHEFRIIRPDGSIRWIWNRGFPVHEPEGQISRFVGVAQDITERKHAEQMQRRHERETMTINNILCAINTHLDVKAAFPEVCAGLRELAGCAAVWLSLFDERREWLSFAASNTPWALLGAGPGTRLHVTEWPGATDVLAGRPHIIPDLTTVLQFPIAEVNYAFGFRSVVNLPLCAGSNVIGLLDLFWREVDGCHSVEIGTLAQVANSVAIAVEKSRLFEEVRAGRERLAALSRRLMEVQEAERRHIARELHDEIGQHLTGINLLLGGFEHLSVEGAAARLKEVRASVTGLVSRVRDVSLDLRPAMLDDLGVLPALSWLFTRYTAQTGIKVAFKHRALQQRFTAEQETAVYRIVQEALTNVARYARVSSVSVDAWADGDTLGVSVTDHGVGFDVGAVLANGVSGGLAGMRERAMLLGGRLTVESNPGAGTRLIVELPLSSEPGFHVQVGK